MVKFTEKQQRFIDEYLVDLNATQSAIRAGYSERTASAQASRLLTNVNIRARIEELKKTRADRLNLDAYWVLKRLMDISDRSMQAEPVMQWDYEEQQLVPSGEYQFDSSGANRSTELIGKHLGMFKETIKHEGELNVTFVDDIGREEDAT
ncbi:Phage terminase, small subunit [Planococcus halocryophilus Or1]|uniref:Terminase n=1 Tax=Planococcus halocryophilus TaxID=1215089 RepID=A0A1C7DPQ3_9BACL|nr:terminase small subunit [Planococcus halocryophilus]ANU13476.1 terminase [Planococcus halocryophilus]EMF46281.1 Phage terminase, small subunit [Planococcus halocryophilus Or1]